MKNAIMTQGTLLERYDKNDGIKTTILQVVKIADIGFERPTIDITCLGSTFSEVIPTIGENKPINLEVIYYPQDGSQRRLMEDVYNNILAEWSIVFPTTTYDKFYFDAYVTSFTVSAELKDKVMASVVLTPSGIIQPLDSNGAIISLPV